MYDNLLGRLIWIVMSSFNPSPLFPSNLETPMARSLTLQLILETLKGFAALKNPSEFPFDKLQFHSEVLAKGAPANGAALICALEEIRKVLFSFKIRSILSEKIAKGEAPQLLASQLQECLKDYFQKLTPLLRESRSDENLLVYLIENRDTFNEFLGEKCIQELLQSFFPTGHDQLRAVIYEGYNRRGFDSFFASVEPLINEICW